MRLGARTAALWLAALGTALGGCSTGADGSADDLTVLAASSLTDVFPALAARFEAAHPGVEVRLSFAASSVLAQQVVGGAPADVLATADLDTMSQVGSAGLADKHPPVFATNTLVVVTPPDNPAGVRAIEDLADPAVAVALCAPDVPCGEAASELLRADQVRVTPVTLEPDVRSVLTKVRLGEVDAGIVYVTDALSAGAGVRTVRPRNASRVVSRYPLSALRASDQPALAQAFVDLVLSPAGQRVLSGAGFGPP